MAAPLNRLQNLRSLKIANIDGAFSTAFATLVTGSFQVGFLRLLGASDLWINFMAALPSLLGCLQIPGAIIGRRYGSYKPYVALGGGIWRLFYAPLIILPLVALGSDARLILLASCIGIASASVLLVQPIYNEWLSAMVPENSRGWFFSRRNAIVTAVGALIGLLGGFVLDRFRKNGEEALGLSVVFGAGIACAAISYGFFLAMRDLPRENPVAAGIKSGFAAIKLPFADAEFRRVLLFIAFFFLGQMFAGNLYGAYALETLKLSFTSLQLLGLANATGIVVAARFWGFIADKYGNKPTLVMAGLGIATNPIAWLVTTPDNPYNVHILFGGHIIMGFFWSGVAVSQFNILLATSKPEDRANYLGAGLALQSVVSGLAPLLGAGLMTALRANFDPLLAYKGVFLTALLLRATAVLFLIPVREPGSSGVKQALQDLRRVRPRTMRTMRRLTRSTDTAARAEALEQVGVQRLALASDEVVKSLADPSPQVRRQAAYAVARLGNPALLSPLLSHIEQHPDLVEEETIHALGNFQGEEAIAPLVQFLGSPRSQLRRAAAEALGRIGNQAAVIALVQSAGEQDDPDLQRASIDALRRIGSSDAAQVIAEGLYSPYPSVRIASAEAITELHLPMALPALRQALDNYHDETSSEIAYALCAVGTAKEIPTVLQVASRSKTALARRRCLLGIARLLGVEAESYKLFLLSGMSRDSALLEMMRLVSKRSRKVRAAVERYSAGDEPAALMMLAQATQDPLVKEIAERAVRDSFIILAPYVSRSFSPTSRESSARSRPNGA